MKSNKGTPWGAVIIILGLVAFFAIILVALPPYSMEATVERNLKIIEFFEVFLNPWGIGVICAVLVALFLASRKIEEG